MAVGRRKAVVTLIVFRVRLSNEKSPKAPGYPCSKAYGERTVDLLTKSCVVSVFMQFGLEF
jgi:hypothetical protein